VITHSLEKKRVIENKKKKKIFFVYENFTAEGTAKIFYERGTGIKILAM